MDSITIGSRESDLALEQTRQVINKLKQLDSDYHFKVKKLTTRGDERLDLPLYRLSNQGVFTSDFEQSIKNGEIDCAVHSMKDLQVRMDPELTIAAVPSREDPREALISNGNLSLHELPPGAIVGTSSSRRITQIKAKRPDLTTKWIRGPVNARIEQLRKGDFDAIILAVAGLKRLDLAHLITEYLPLDSFLPAACQGALAIQCHAHNEKVKDLLKAIHDNDTALATQTEQSLIQVLDPYERAPIGCLATVESGVINLKAMLLTTDGQKTLFAKSQGREPDSVIQDVKNQLFEQGAEQVIAEFKDE